MKFNDVVIVGCYFVVETGQSRGVIAVRPTFTFRVFFC